MQALWMIIPEEAYILIILGAGLAVMLGLLKFRGAMALIGTICLIVLLTPFIGSIIDALPNWAFMLLLFWIVYTILKMLLGRRVMERVLSRIIFQLLILPFKILGRFIGINRRR